MRIGCKMKNKLKYSHTHWQAPQADTQSNAEKKKLKISFPSKNFKNANPQTDTHTFEQ